MVADKKLTLDEDGCSLDRKSTSGVATFFGSCIITWGSKKENSVALLTAKAEYVVAGLLQSDTANASLMDQERQLRESYMLMAEARDDFLKQKAKCDWEKDSDTNCDMFHHAIRKRNIVTQGELLEKHDWDSMCRIPTEEDVRNALFSIPDDKSPGPDGYTSCFFKGKLLKQLNCTTLVLIPKVENPNSVKEFRPIACCNTIYKIISKLLCDRMSCVLGKIISPNQCAFIKGRSILGNILIIQDLVRLYTRNSVSPRCLMKVDLRKAYDSIEWLHGLFNGKRGLGQRDPMSPLLFTLCREYLSRLLKLVSQMHGFQFHPLCKSLKLTHLMFADDLLIFCKGDVRTIFIVMEAFKRFSNVSGLNINSDKSDFYSNGMSPALVQKVLHGTGFKSGDLPFRIQALYMNFIWEGEDKYSKAPLVAWNVLCPGKEYVGLGIIDSKLWNVEAIGKLVWWLASKQDQLWIKWVNNIYIKEANWLQYEPTNYSSLAWRKICEVKNTLKAGYVNGKWRGTDVPYTIADGYQWLMQGPAVKPMLKLTEDDVKEEMAYWKLAIYGYVMGANPPWKVLDGFLRRIWSAYKIKKISFLPNGLFVVRFAKAEHHKLVLANGRFLFDGKPIVIKPWDPSDRI
ncbi:uncharacterized protein LOC141588414 [Silene latifolia]|uniref:uncharacterized protein LOC141588414 n=1 Tax=Silene latifolia TaxID=37657 RepID=UPI003D76FDFC